MELTWKILGIKKVTVPSLGDVVSEVQWEVTGTDEDGVSGSVANSTYFDLAEVNAESFIPYDNLSEQTVIDWVKSKVTGGYLDHVKFLIQKRIDETKYSEQQVNQFPWQS